MQDVYRERPRRVRAVKNDSWSKSTAFAMKCQVMFSGQIARWIISSDDVVTLYLKDGRVLSVEFGEYVVQPLGGRRDQLPIEVWSPERLLSEFEPEG